MPDTPQTELDKIVAERTKIFTPQWFKDLLGAHLGFGDTYWLGNFGVLMFVVPAATLIAGLFYAEAPGVMMPFLRLVSVAMGLWLIGVAQALVRLRPRDGWSIFGVIWTAGAAIACLITAATL